MGRKRHRLKRERASRGSEPEASGAPGRRERVLAVVHSDTTFEPAEWRGGTIWLGRCLMCGKNVMVSSAGALLEQATLEHILPRGHGGDDRVENLAIACARCNHQKGSRVDALSQHDARRQEIVRSLLQRRRDRWRDPKEKA